MDLIDCCSREFKQRRNSLPDSSDASALIASDVPLGSPRGAEVAEPSVPSTDGFAFDAVCRQAIAFLKGEAATPADTATLMTTTAPDELVPQVHLTSMQLYLAARAIKSAARHHSMRAVTTVAQFLVNRLFFWRVIAFSQRIAAACCRVISVLSK